MILGKLVTVVISVWAFIYTASYARWTWNKKNRLGAAAVFILALAVLVLPIYTAFFRG